MLSDVGGAGDFGPYASGGVLAAAGATGGGIPATFEDPERAGRTYVIYDAPKARLYPASSLQWAESLCTLLYHLFCNKNYEQEFEGCVPQAHTYHADGIEETFKPPLCG